MACLWELPMETYWAYQWVFLMVPKKVRSKGTQMESQRDLPRVSRKGPQ